MSERARRVGSDAGSRRASRQAAAQAAMAPRQAASCSALIVPLLLLAFWQVATHAALDAADPDARAMSANTWSISPFGGIYDDAYSATCSPICWLDEPRLWRLRAGRVVRAAARPDDRPHRRGARSCSIRSSGDAADPGHRLAAAVDDPVRARAEAAFFLVFLGAFYPILLNTMFGVRSVDPRLFEAAVDAGLHAARRMFCKVVLPAALPSIFTGLRLGHGFAWIVIVVGEMTGVPTGLGAVIMDGRTLSRTELVICRHDRDRRRGLRLRPHHRADRQPPAALEPATSCLTRRCTAASMPIRDVRRDQALHHRRRRRSRRCATSTCDRQGRVRLPDRRSGCGKSTLLRIIAGFETADRAATLLMCGQADRRARHRPRHGVPGLRAVPLADGARRTSASVRAARGLPRREVEGDRRRVHRAGRPRANSPTPIRTSSPAA